jgi:hypothetical protein
VIAYRQHAYCWPGEEFAYCAKPGCQFRWNGIGSFEFVKSEHEKLNEAEDQP